MPQDIDRYIDDHLGESLHQLSRLVGQPSISSQNVGMRECAELVATMLAEVGFEARVMDAEPYPVVYAEAPGRSDRTLICYNHYDVQPPEPLDLWDSPPFELTTRDGKAYGRGIADDKGHIISRLAALQAVREVHGEFPCRIKFLIEGGEEISSPNLPEFIDAHRDLLAADWCVWETGGVTYGGRPTLTLGMRGILYVEYFTRTMSRDAHSGQAHLLPNAAWRLVRALNTLKDGEHIRIPGFYDRARPMTEVERGLLDALPLQEEAIQASYGIDSFIDGLEGARAKEAVFSPTANIAGLSSGYEGEGSKTVIPATATAKMDFRLVPDQDPDEIYAALKTFLADEGFGDVEVRRLGGERAATTPWDDPFVQLTARTARQVYGSDPVVSPLTGGSGPMYAFREYLGVPIVTVGIGNPETLIHAPNENIVIQDFVLGTKHMAHLVESLRELGA